MSRKLSLSLLGLVGLAAVAPALAQFLPAAPPPPPPIQQMPQMHVQVARPIPPAAHDQNVATIEPWMTPELAKAAIEKLQADKHKLREQLQITLSEYQKALARLDEMTRVGGSLVTAHCEGLVSVTTSGVSEDCAASGYACNHVSGLCERSCHQDSGDKCAPGYLCDGSDHCEPPPERS